MESHTLWMMEQIKMASFLEPIYLNELMVLNCAAYLFKGVSLESEEIAQAETSVDGGLRLGIPFLRTLLSPLSVEGSAQRNNIETSRSARQYTVGGLHMVVLDELRSRKMIHTGSSNQVSDLLRLDRSYVDIEVILNPSDYYAIISTLKAFAPLAGQIFQDFGKQIITKATGPAEDRTFEPDDPANPRGERDSFEKIGKAAERYQNSIISILDRLESDYLTSRQLEMVMWSRKDDKPIGVIELDASDYDPNELKAKLTGGEFRVIGKIIRKTGQRDTMSLVQKTILSQALDLFERILELDRSGSTITNFRKQFGPMREHIQKLLLLEIPGPAVRIAAMSVCI